MAEEVVSKDKSSRESPDSTQDRPLQSLSDVGGLESLPKGNESSGSNKSSGNLLDDVTLDADSDDLSDLKLEDLNLLTEISDDNGTPLLADTDKPPSIEELAQYTGDENEVQRGFWSSLKNTFKKIGSGIKNAFKKVGNAFKKVSNFVKKIGISIWGTIKSTANWIGKLMRGGGMWLLGLDYQGLTGLVDAHADKKLFSQYGREQQAAIADHYYDDVVLGGATLTNAQRQAYDYFINQLRAGKL